MSNQPTTNINCKLYWPKLTVTDDSGKYSVDLAGLSDSAVAWFEDSGIKVNNKGDDRGNYITCRSKNKMRAFNIDRSEISLKGRTPLSSDDDPESGSIVANGSTATCLVGYYDWEYKGKKGRSPSLKRMVISDLIEYAPEMNLEDAL
jgi:hypothetical protein